MNQTLWPWEQAYRKNRIVTVRTYRMRKKLCLISDSSICAKRSRKRSSEAIEDSHDKRRYNLLRSARSAREEGHQIFFDESNSRKKLYFLRCARSAREEGHQKQLKIHTIKKDITFFRVREALGKNVIRSFSWCRPS